MKKQEVDHILARMLDSFDNVSDLNITAGKPFQVESSGQLAPVDMEPAFTELTPFQTEVFALNLINQDRRLTETLLIEGSCDCSYDLPGKARFRVNIFSQLSNYSIVLRKLESKIPTVQDMNLPATFLKMAEEKNGIIFITGATGSGKTTSLAAVLNEVNEDKSVHVVTLEDPVEYQHPHKKATFNQREMGNDFDTFASGLRAALRQAPKVILVGEMRDRETVEIGLSAAETGHLVMSTLHTSDAMGTINRIISMFPAYQQGQIRLELAEVLKATLSMRLVRKKDGKGRVPAVEVLLVTDIIRQCIIESDKTMKIPEYVEAGRSQYGMQSFDQALLDLFKGGLISYEEALLHCTRPADFALKVKGIQSTQESVKSMERAKRSEQQIFQGTQKTQSDSSSDPTFTKY